MLVTQKSFIFHRLPSYLVNKNGSKFFTIIAKRKASPENPQSRQQPIFPLRVSNTNLARSVIAVLGLGFLDAGYSGDWSRIGVLSKETEDLLKVAAFAVVPFCIFLVVYLSNDSED